MRVLYIRRRRMCFKRTQTATWLDTRVAWLRVSPRMGAPIQYACVCGWYVAVDAVQQEVGWSGVNQISYANQKARPNIT